MTIGQLLETLEEDCEIYSPSGKLLVRWQFQYSKDILSVDFQYKKVERIYRENGKIIVTLRGGEK